MFRPLSLYIGLRYLRAKQHNHFISFMTLTSTLGIALGVSVIVTVLSIMNGFDQAVKTKIFDISHHVTIQELRQKVSKAEWPTLRKQVLQEPHVLGAAPFLVSQGLASHTNQSQPIAMYGIIPAMEQTVSGMGNYMKTGQFSLHTNDDDIIIGDQLADLLNAKVGSELIVYLPILEKGLFTLTPRSKKLKVAGIFQTKKGFGLDSSIAYVHLKVLQTLSEKEHDITGLRIKVKDLYKAPILTDMLTEHLPPHYIISDWTAHYSPLLNAIALEKTVTLWILLLLVAIAAFNLLSSLVMIVTEKKAEIAILRTLGASTTTVVGIFITQGTIIGILGTLLGLGSGWVLSQYISAIAQFVEKWLQIQFFEGNIFIQQLPCLINLKDFIWVGSISILISLIATIYPALRAAKTLPIETLRYE